MTKEKSKVYIGGDKRVWYHRIRGIFGDNESHSRRDLTIGCVVFLVVLFGVYVYISGAVWFLERIFGV